MEYTWDKIRENVTLMQAAQGPMMQKMRDILIRYDGDWVIPMVDVKNEPKMPQLTPALVGEAIDQLALRAASTRPDITSPAIDPKRTGGRRSADYARIRARAIEATLEKSRWGLGRRRYYRHLTAYHTAAAVCLPDTKLKMPVIEVRDPMSAFCEPQANESLRDPNYVAFVSRWSAKHLRTYFPKSRQELGGPVCDRDVTAMWTVVEWYDHEDIVWGLMGPVDPYSQSAITNLYGISVAAVSNGADYSSGPTCELERLPNRAGVLPAVMPRNVSLAGIASRIGSLLGNVDLQARMMALAVVGQEKAVFPDAYVIGRGGAEPVLTNGTWKDGRTGEVNFIQDAEQVGVLRQTVDPMTGQMLDRLERNFRTSTSLIPQMGGETYGAMRTGRAMDALGGFAVDPRVQELHEITEQYLPTLQSAVLATYKGYWGSKQYSLYCGYGRSRTAVVFTPDEHFETFDTGLSYIIPGTDTTQLTQILGSMYGAGAISLRTFQENHPYVNDSDGETAQIREEALETAAMGALSQQLMQGALPPQVAVLIIKHLRKGSDIFDALDKANKELQATQATPAGPAPEGMVAPPETMPGLTGGPAADQNPLPPEQQNVQVPGDAVRMKQLMSTMAAG
jgi:hypothetical protein